MSSQMRTTRGLPRRATWVLVHSATLASWSRAATAFCTSGEAICSYRAAAALAMGNWLAMALPAGCCAWYCDWGCAWYCDRGWNCCCDMFVGPPSLPPVRGD